MDIIYRYDPHQPIALRPHPDAESAIEELRDGHARYVRYLMQIRREVVGGHASEAILVPSDPLTLSLPFITGEAPVQAPYALVLGCSDARVPIEWIFDQSSNDLFIVRVAGNVLGIECLGSIDYAVEHLDAGLKLVVVLGHSGCGAVSAAVDAYLTPRNYAAIAFTHALRSLVDRIQIAVRGAANALESECGPSVSAAPNYRAALIECAVYLNAAVTAFDVCRELRNPVGSPRVRVVYGVFDLVSQHVRAHPEAASEDDPSPAMPAAVLFGEVPDGPEGFRELGARLAAAIVAKGLLR